MRKTLGVLSLTMVAIGIAGWSAPHVDRQCVPEADAYYSRLHTFVATLIASPKRASTRQTLTIPVLDSSALRQVVSDSVCKRISEFMSHERGIDASHRGALYAMRAGPYYFALDSTVRTGEFHLLYVMDSTLNRVLGRLTY